MEYIEKLNIPVIFITAKGSLKDKVKGLRIGADDYILKSFKLDEVVLRRYGKTNNKIVFKDTRINTKMRLVKKSLEKLIEQMLYFSS